MLRATKIRIYPDAEQRCLLATQFGCARWVYNDALAYRKRVYDEAGELVSRNMLCKRLPVLKGAHTWLKAADSQVLQAAVANLDKAYRNFFAKRARFPKFKKKVGKQSIHYPQRVQLKGSLIRLPKVGWVRAVIHREIGGKVKTVTVSKTSTSKYFASVLTDDGKELPSKPSHVTKVTGVDLGLTHYLITDNGIKVANPRFLRRAYNNLRKKQKSLSRKKKGSKNRSKARLLVAKAHERVANARADFQHKLSFHLVDENQAVGMETLRVKNMLKNRKLSRAVADASWSSFVGKVGYKCEWAGKYLVKVDAFFPSTKTCSSCSHKLDALPLDTRVWACPKCGVVHDRDINAAQNIKKQVILKLKAEGCTVSAC